MFSRKYRLPARSKLNHSSSYNIQSVKILISKNNTPNNRYGFVIGKKIHKSAVVRNRVRRVVRSCVEEMNAKLLKGNDMLFIIHKYAINQKRNLIYNEIEELFRKAKVLE